MDSLSLDEWSMRHSSYVGPPPVYPWNEPTQVLPTPVYPSFVSQPKPRQEDTVQHDRCDGNLLSDEIPTFNLLDRDDNQLPSRPENSRESISERI